MVKPLAELTSEELANLDETELARRALAETEQGGDKPEGSEGNERDETEPEEETEDKPGAPPETPDKAPAEPPAEPEGEASEEETGPEQEGEKEGAAAPETPDKPAPPSPRPPKPAAGAPTPILDRLREHGWKHTFKSEDDALEAIVQLRSVVGRKSELEELGRIAREAGLSTEQLRQMQKEAEEEKETDNPFAFRPPVPFNPQWSQQLKVDDKGEVQGPAELVKDYLAFESYRQHYWQEVGAQPERLLLANRKVLFGLFDEWATEQRRAQAEAEAPAKARKFYAEHGALIRRHEDEFADLLRQMPPDRAVELLELRELKAKGKPAAPTGQPGKEKDLARLGNKLQRTSGRTGGAGSPATRDADLSQVDEVDLARQAVAELGIELPS